MTVALLFACAHSESARQAEENPARPTAVVAQACTPGMSCFGRVVMLPNGEVAEAAAAAAAATATTAATAAAIQASAGSKSKAKTSDKAKVKTSTTVTQLKRRVTCELWGANVKQPNKKIRCSYHCPDDPPGVVHDVFLDIPECPSFWDFYV